MKPLHFYAVIIGTEILNGRRTDRHFAFLKESLSHYGHTLFASLVITDDAALIESTFRMIRSDPGAVMFSFGGIGSTPDDLTRAIAAKVFTGKPLVRHEQFDRDIIERFGDAAYPHRIHMADLPENAALLKNPVNNMSGFSLDDRYFFTPGFPEMAHPMVENALQKHFSQIVRRYRKTLIADTSENTLIDIMKQLPDTIEFSSLPMFRGGTPKVEISVAGTDETEVENCFALFTAYLKRQAIGFNLT